MWGFGSGGRDREDGAEVDAYPVPVAAPRYIIVEISQVAQPVLVGKYPLLPNQLPSMDGSWSWLMKENQELHRNTRLHAGQLLRVAFDKQGYAMRLGRNTRTVRFRKISKMCSDTEVHSVEAGLPRLSARSDAPLVFDRAGNPMDKAVDLTKGGHAVAVVNAASAYHAGGGFTSGGRHALEEAFCSQSTLYKSLAKIAAKTPAYIFRDGQKSYHSHIPEDGCILSPCVEVFRRGTDQGYPLVAEPVEIKAVISVAMYNRNPAMRDAPVDAPANREQYLAGVRDKMRALVHTAIYARCDALVVPAIGCGVFQNDPVCVGTILAEVLLEYHGYFRMVVFTGASRFFDAVAGAIQGAPRAAPRLTRTLPLERSTEMLFYCSVCQQRLGSGSGLAHIMGPHGEAPAPPLYIHAECSDELDRPDHVARALPDPSLDPEGFFRAADADGNGTLDKEEVRWLVGALWTGPIENFAADFDAKWERWDQDHSGDLRWNELSASKSLRRGGNVADALSGPGRGTLNLDGVPDYFLDWIKAQAGGVVGPDEYPDTDL